MKNLYIQANRQIHPSEKLKNETIMKMNHQLEKKSWFSSKMALALASCCLCAGLSGLVSHLSQDSNEAVENSGLMAANELESAPQAFSLNNSIAYPEMVEDYQLIMEAYSEDGTTILTYQNNSKVFTVSCILLENEKMKDGVILEKENEILLFESEDLSNEELEGFVDYFK